MEQAEFKTRYRAASDLYTPMVIASRRTLNTDERPSVSSD